MNRELGPARPAARAPANLQHLKVAKCLEDAAAIIYWKELTTLRLKTSLQPDASHS